MSAASVHFLRSLSLSVGMALATSCFAMLSGMAGAAGPWLLPAIGASLLVALAVARAIGGLARRFPSALGMRTYTKAAFGNTASLFFVFAYLLMVMLVAAVESNLYGNIVAQLLPGVPAPLVVLAVFATVFVLNAFGHEHSRNVQLGLVGFMLAGLLALALCGLFSSVSGAWPAWGDAAQQAAAPTAAVTAFFLFVGFEWVTSAQSGSRQAAAQLPRVLLVAVLLLGTMYLVFGAAMLRHFDAATLAATRMPQLLLAQRLWGEPGRWAVLLISTAAVLMAFNAGVLGASRLLYGLAREAVLPRTLLVVAPGSGAPVRAMALTVAVALAGSVAARTLGASDLFGGVAAMLICLCYAALLLASVVLARRQTAPRPRRGMLIDAAALLVIALLTLGMLFDPAAHTTAVAALAACVLCLVFALAAVQCTSRLPLGRPASSRLGLSTQRETS